MLEFSCRYGLNKLFKKVLLTCTYRVTDNTPVDPRTDHCTDIGCDEGVVKVVDNSINSMTPQNFHLLGGGQEEGREWCLYLDSSKLLSLLSLAVESNNLTVIVMLLELDSLQSADLSSFRAAVSMGRGNVESSNLQKGTLESSMEKNRLKDVVYEINQKKL